MWKLHIHDEIEYENEKPHTHKLNHDFVTVATFPQTWYEKWMRINTIHATYAKEMHMVAYSKSQTKHDIKRNNNVGVETTYTRWDRIWKWKSKYSLPESWFCHNGNIPTNAVWKVSEDQHHPRNVRKRNAPTYYTHRKQKKCIWLRIRKDRPNTT